MSLSSLVASQSINDNNSCTNDTSTAIKSYSAQGAIVDTVDVPKSSKEQSLSNLKKAPSLSATKNETIDNLRVAPVAKMSKYQKAFNRDAWKSIPYSKRPPYYLMKQMVDQSGMCTKEMMNGRQYQRLFFAIIHPDEMTKQKSHYEAAPKVSTNNSLETATNYSAAPSFEKANFDGSLQNLSFSSAQTNHSSLPIKADQCAGASIAKAPSIAAGKEPLSANTAVHTQVTPQRHRKQQQNSNRDLFTPVVTSRKRKGLQKNLSNDLVEEDPLPSHLYPCTIADSMTLHQRRQRLMQSSIAKDSSRTRFMIGNSNDQIEESLCPAIAALRTPYSIKPLCGKEYCTCLESGIFCHQTCCECSICHNSIPDVQKRHFNVLYPSVVLSQSRLQALPPRNQNVASKSIGNNSIDTSFSQALNGISFIKADPNVESYKVDKKEKSAPKRLYHDLFLNPSKIVTTPNNTSTSSSMDGSVKAVEFSFEGEHVLNGTELERMWARESSKLNELFNEMRKKTKLFHRPATGLASVATATTVSSPISKQSRYEQHTNQHHLPEHNENANVQTSSVSPDSKRQPFCNESEAAKQAQKILGILQEDMKSIFKVVEAAELEALTYFHEQPKSSTRKSNSPHLVNDIGINNIDLDEGEKCNLHCQEILSVAPVVEARPAELSETYQQNTILAWQETALLQEAARIIRRKARELCESRVIKENVI